MICENCPYSEKINGLVNQYKCSQRPGVRAAFNGCSLLEHIRNGRRDLVDDLLGMKKVAIEDDADTVEIDFEEDTVEIVYGIDQDETDKLLDEIIMEMENDGFSQW